MMSNASITRPYLDKARIDLDGATSSLRIVWDNVDDSAGRQLALAVEALGRAIASVSCAVERLDELPHIHACLGDDCDNFNDVPCFDVGPPERHEAMYELCGACIERYRVEEPDGRTGRTRLMPVDNHVEHPACACCPHTEMSDLQRDQLNREVWDGCPDSGCLREFCRFCRVAVRLKAGPNARRREALIVQSD